jgi:alpha-galactosidase/6-phospho-beta-glucosidase family protein
VSHKISIIGAGSAVFSLGMVCDLCLTPSLRGSTISFMDIDQARLDAIHALCTRYAREIGIELDLHKTTDRRESLQGADIVVNAALAAGHHRLRAGWEIAQRYGYRWGGSLHVMHDEAFWINFTQLRLFDSVIADVLDVCPDAWYIQAANPVQAGITYLARKYPRAKVVGLCHGYGGVYHIARALGLDRKHLTFELPGVNHFIWLTKLFYKGEDAMPLLDRWIAEEAPRYWKVCGTGDELGPKKVDLYKRVGAYPIGDTAGDGGGSWGWWYHLDEAAEQRWREKPGAFWQRFFSGGEHEVAKIQAISADPAARVTEHFPPEMSGENIVPMVEALLCDTPRVIISNIPNSGDFVPGVPRDFQVEVPALVSRRGVQGIQTGGLPPAALSYLLRDCVALVNLELAAYVSHDRELLLELIMQDPWTRSAEQARGLLDEIMALPFHYEMREYFA